jgi:hypothetical protein
MTREVEPERVIITVVDRLASRRGEIAQLAFVRALPALVSAPVRGVVLFPAPSHSCVLKVIAPPCGASRLRSEFRRSG